MYKTLEFIKHVTRHVIGVAEGIDIAIYVALQNYWTTGCAKSLLTQRNRNRQKSKWKYCTMHFFCSRLAHVALTWRSRHAHMALKQPEKWLAYLCAHIPLNSCSERVQKRNNCAHIGKLRFWHAMSALWAHF